MLEVCLQTQRIPSFALKLKEWQFMGVALVDLRKQLELLKGEVDQVIVKWMQAWSLLARGN